MQASRRSGDPRVRDPLWVLGFMQERIQTTAGTEFEVEVARVQPQQVSGSLKDGRRRRRMRGQTPSLMPEIGQPLSV